MAHAGGGAAGSRSNLLVAGGLGCVVLGLYAFFVWQYWFLGDDAFISFRYARNLVDGHGLVFNPGERVEGYSNFLWVLLMAGAMKLSLPVETLANLLGIACGGALLWLVARLGARESGWTDPFVWVAPLALAVNRSFAAWSTGGLATQLFALLVFAAALRFCDERERGDTAPWPSALLFAAASLTRPEGPLFFAVAGAFFSFDWLVLRRRPGRAWLLWIASFGAIVGAHLLWRHAYYGAWVPNTFHAKVSGLWLDQGAAYLALFASDHWLPWLLPLLLPLFWWGREFRIALFAAILGAWTLYLLAVGGDRFEYRFVTPVLPFLFVLLQDSLRRSARVLSARPGWQGDLGTFAAIVAALAVVVGAYRPHTLGFTAARGIVSVEMVAEYAEQRSEEGRFLRSLVDEGILSGDVLVAVGGAGALPYYSGLPTLDVLGLNDAAIARQPLAARGVVGHEKFAPPEYLRERRVAIVDVFNRIVWPEGAAEPKTEVVDTPFYSGPTIAVRIRDRWLAFATTLSPDEFKRAFPTLEVRSMRAPKSPSDT